MQLIIQLVSNYGTSTSSENVTSLVRAHGELAQAMMIHKDHVSAVMDVSFSPTGQEFASGSYDRTVRVFPHRSGRSREVYHTKRMQRVFCVNFSADARYRPVGDKRGESV